MDPKVNGQLQKEWGWLIAVYLYLGGVGAGAYVIAAINSFLGGTLALSTTVGLWISWPALAIGSICLLFDLGNPFRAALAGMKPGSSWMARGFWIISLFMILAFLHFVLLYTDFSMTPLGSAVVLAISIAAIITGVLTMAYTGILLGASKGIPFWRSGVVPVVFVVSALVTGHFAIMLGLAFVGVDSSHILSELRIMGMEAAGLVVLEVLAIIFFIQAAYKQPDSRESAERLLDNRPFMVGYFVFGLGVPLALMLAVAGAFLGMDLTANLSVVVGGAALGLLGGLILRWAVLTCGTLPTLNIAGFQFRRIARPKDQRPDIGMMPPS